MSEFVLKNSIARIFIIVGIFLSITAFSTEGTEENNESLANADSFFKLESTIEKLDDKTSALLGLSGKVFEDINYGGGNGRTYAAANASAQSSGWPSNTIAVDNAIVELYDSAGNYISSTTTNVSGAYTFTGILDDTYQIRVVNSSVSSNRGSNSTNQTILPIQTFRTDGTSDILNEVGGSSPTL